MLTGIRPSLSSEPGRRRAATSSGLIELIELPMNRLSPQLSTCWPRRTLPGRSAISYFCETKASRNSAPDERADISRPSSLICLNGRSSSFSSKSYQYLPRTKTLVSP
ncbi:hypothetical protein D3C81_1620680 [compost metagenome]